MNVEWDMRRPMPLCHCARASRMTRKLYVHIASLFNGHVFNCRLEMKTRVSIVAPTSFCIVCGLSRMFHTSSATVSEQHSGIYFEIKLKFWSQCWIEWVRAWVVTRRAMIKKCSSMGKRLVHPYGHWIAQWAEWTFQRFARINCWNVGIE